MDHSPIRSLVRPFRPALAAARGRAWRSLCLSPLTGTAVLVCAAAAHRWHPVLLDYTADTPWRAALIALPLTVVAPAEHLPYWGAALQTVVVLAVAQPILGVRRLLTVALAGHVLATLGMRALVHICAFAVPHSWAVEQDSGPSVAVLAVLAAAGVGARALWLPAAVITGTLLEVLVLHGQAGVEHLTGVVVAGTIATAWRWAERRRRSGRGRRQASVVSMPSRHTAAA